MADRGRHLLRRDFSGTLHKAEFGAQLSYNGYMPGGDLALPGAALLRLATFLELQALANLYAAVRTELLQQLLLHLVHGMGPYAMEFWAAQLKDAVASIICNGSRGVLLGAGDLVLALESTPKARSCLEGLFGPDVHSSFQSHGSLLFAEGPEAARLLLQLLGEPLVVYRLLRNWISSACYRGFVVFGAEGKTVAWRPPEPCHGISDLPSIVLGAYAYTGDGSALSLHVATSLDHVQEGRADAPSQDMETFREIWDDFCDGQVPRNVPGFSRSLINRDGTRMKVLGSSFLPEVRCRCGMPILTEFELQRLRENLPVCIRCEANMLSWEREAESEAAARLKLKAKAKARQERKVKQHHGSSSKPYSQKRR